MTNEPKDLATQVAEKKAEIEHYKGVLSRSLGSRWYDQGRRRLADLEAELVVIETETEIESNNASS